MRTDSIDDPRTDVQTASDPCQTNRDHIEHVGIRVDDRPVALNPIEYERLVSDRSLELVGQSRSGSGWGDTGSGSAQLACGLLLDYTDDEAVVSQHYIQFRDDVVSQLECSGPANCWHFTGDDIKAAFVGVTKHEVLTSDDGMSTPSLSVNWSTVNRSKRVVSQWRDIDHYVVLGEGTEEWLPLLCAQGDRVYPAPPDIGTVLIEEDPAPAVRELIVESNDLVEPEEDMWWRPCDSLEPHVNSSNTQSKRGSTSAANSSGTTTGGSAREPRVQMFRRGVTIHGQRPPQGFDWPDRVSVHTGVGRVWLLDPSG